MLPPQKKDKVLRMGFPRKRIKGKHEGAFAPLGVLAGRNKLQRALLVLGFLLGLGIFVYPLISNLQYEQEQEQIAAAYDEAIARIEENQTDDGEDAQKKIDDALQAARDYNEALVDNSAYLTDPFDQSKMNSLSVEPYSNLLNINGDNVMGYIEIPKISAKLAVYHGTSADVLQAGVGHLQATSLPVGGETTHSVLSGHSGLAGKKLFTDLDQLEEGDVFYMHVLGETLAYKVDKISVVLPDDVSDLSIEQGKDYMTLVTCTPYGVNDHRLLVRGVRVDYEEAKALEEEEDPAGLSIWQKYYLGIAAASVVILTTTIVVLRRRARAAAERGRQSELISSIDEVFDESDF